MSEPDEQHESDFECPGCAKQFNGHGTLAHHTERCQKALLLVCDDVRELDEQPGDTE